MSDCFNNLSQYQAGYNARMNGEPMNIYATEEWLEGWEAADQE